MSWQLIAPFTAAAVVNDDTNQKNSVGECGHAIGVRKRGAEQEFRNQRKVANRGDRVQNRTAMVSRRAIIFLLFVF
jgi:hypothetical protein